MALAESKTLGEIRRHFGESETPISYLAVDGVGSELKTLADWTSSSALSGVNQIGLSFYTGIAQVPPERHVDTLRQLIEGLQAMYRKGFRLTAYNPDLCAGKALDLESKFYTNFDVLLMRSGYT